MRFCEPNWRGRCRRCGACAKRGVKQNCPSRRRCKPRARVAVHRPRLGTRIRQGLELIGYTQARHQRIREALGAKKPCGCRKREAALNRADARARRALARFGRRLADGLRRLAGRPAPLRIAELRAERRAAQRAPAAPPDALAARRLDQYHAERERRRRAAA